jgi:hypothetical protein
MPCVPQRNTPSCPCLNTNPQIYAAVQPTDHGFTALLSIPGETLPPGFVPKLHW